MDSLRVIIIEDEPVTARNLIHLLQLADENIVVNTTLNSVADATAWFKDHSADHELIFMDIRLADGLSFDIFKQVNITKPVIFVTAYNDYAIQAFRNNGIDYILKPFDEEDVTRALNKFKSFTKQPGSPVADLPFARLIEQLNLQSKIYKKSFLVHFRDKLIPLETGKVSWFYTANELVYAHTIDGRQYVMDFTMEQLEQQLDPSQFFRANRQFIIHRKEIAEVDFYFNGRLSVKVKPEPPEHIIISKARAPEFKNWMNS